MCPKVAVKMQQVSGSVKHFRLARQGRHKKMICLSTKLVHTCSKITLSASCKVNQNLFTLLFIIQRTVLLSSIKPEAETLDFSTHALLRNLLKIFPPRERKQRQRYQATW